MDGQVERAVREKKPVPEIDFTLHTMEDGATVSTQERVCKGKHMSLDRCSNISLTMFRGSSPRDAASSGSSILVATGPLQAKSAVPQAALLQRGTTDRGSSNVDHQEGYRGP